MKPIDLLKKYSLEEIVDEIIKRYSEENRQELLQHYSKAINEILNNKNIPLWISEMGNLYWNKYIEDDEEIYCVGPYHNGIQYGWMGINRNYYYNQHIIFLNSYTSELQVIADILWETTFYGWKEQTSKESLESIQNTMKKYYEEKTNKET